MIGVVNVITAAHQHPSSTAPVRVIEFISLYSNLETQTDTPLKIFIGLGCEYFLPGGQVFFESGSSIFCTQLKRL
jgi:hypothetical protein